jgi:DNA-directed RNA polymerase subunit RPC12/RpoP
MAANLRPSASSPLALAHQSFEPASLTDSVFAIRPRLRRPCVRPGGVTIGQLLTRAHEAAQAGTAASCPMCGGAMHAHGRDARCDDCGSRLA